MNAHIKGDIIQITGLIVVIIGITFEILTGAPHGYIIITIGSLIFAIGCKVKH